MKYDKVTRGGKEYFRYRHWDPVLKKHDSPLYGKTLSELKEKYEVYQAKKLGGIKEDNITFAAFFDQWLRSVHIVGKKPKTIARYKGIQKNYIAESYVGKMTLSNLDSIYFQKWYNDLFEKKGENIVKNLHKLIRPCLRYAFETGRTLKNYGSLLNIPKSHEIGHKKQKIHPLTFDEQMKFIQAIRGNPLEALFNVAIDTGMRQGELFALTWDDIDFENKTININKTYSYEKSPDGSRYIDIVTEPKTESSTRVIPLPNRVEGILRVHKLHQREMLLRAGLKQENISLVFTTVIGTYLNSQNVLKRLKKVYASCGIENKNFHDLRHTYATRLFELGEDPKVVQKLLGHSTVFITLETYTHVLESLKEKAISKIDQLYTQLDSPSEAVGQNLDNCLKLVK